MRISIFSLFRDSEDYLDRCLSSLDSMELETDAQFEYFFLENDSIDNTPNILKQWMKNKNGLLSCENFNSKKFGSTLHSERMLLMSKLRNIMSSLDEKKDSNYSVIFDSDVIFQPNIVNEFLSYLNLEFSLLTANIRQNVPCKMGSGSEDSYYDSSILFDTDGINCMTWSDNPFYNQKDRENFQNNLPVQVQSAFGSFAFLPTKYLSQTSWQSKGESEHLSWCYQLNKIAPIFLIPSIKPRVVIDQKEWEHESKVIERQKYLLENKWNRFLLKTQKNSL